MSGATFTSQVNNKPATPVKSILRKEGSSSSLLRSPKGSLKGRRISWCVEVREESRNSTRALASVRDCIQFLKDGTVLLKIRGHKYVVDGGRYRSPAEVVRDGLHAAACCLLLARCAS